MFLFIIIIIKDLKVEVTVEVLYQFKNINLYEEKYLFLYSKVREFIGWTTLERLDSKVQNWLKIRNFRNGYFLTKKIMFLLMSSFISDFKVLIWFSLAFELKFLNQFIVWTIVNWNSMKILFYVEHLKEKESIVWNFCNGS